MPWLELERSAGLVAGLSGEFAFGPEETRFRIESSEVSIGRGKEESISVPHRSLSRQHARITCLDGRYFITDLQSKNGTYVNDKPVSHQLLMNGDTVRCGEVVFHYRTEPSPRSPLTPDSLPLPAMTCAMPVRLSFGSGDQLSPDGPSLGAGRAPSGPKRQAAAALSTAEREHEKLATLLRVSELLAEPTEIDVVLARILALLFETLDIDRAAILLVDPSTGELLPKAVRSRQPLANDEHIFSRHIVKYVRKHGVAALFGNTRSDPRLAQAASVMAQSICSSMCVPLRPQRETIGVLYVDNLTTPDGFGQEDLEFLAGFASPAALAIHNARLSQELERKAVLENNLIRFFPEAVRRRLLDAPATLHDAVETEATALFADISGYTTLSSRLNPREIIGLLNEYFPRLADAVFLHEGTLEKYIGDALLAVWGAPFRTPDDAKRALSAAVAMQKAVFELSRSWESRLGGPLRIHVGLHTGPVAAGNIGVESYLQYATIGDAINLASRISNVAGPGEIVLSEATRGALGQTRYPLEALPPVLLKGHTGAGTLYRVRWS